MNKWQFTRLSAIQIKELCTKAGQAYKAAKRRGHPDADLNAETYRKNGQAQATSIVGLSLRLATQEHYLPIRGYWWVIIGNVELAFYDFLNAGAQNEAARQLKWRLAGEVSRLADGIKYDKSHMEIPVEIDDTQAAKEAWNYMLAVCVDKFDLRGPDRLNPDELFHLCNTVFNRASAKLKVGKPENRNKKQSMQRRLRKASPVQDDAAEARQPAQAPMSRGNDPVEFAEVLPDQDGGTGRQTA